MRRTVLRFTPEGLRDMFGDFDQRIKRLEQKGDAPPQDDPDLTPLPFHWPGAVVEHVDVRNGPGEFGGDGTIWMVRYRWDVNPTGAATVEWEFDGVTAMTHTLPASTDPHVEKPAEPYAQEAITAIVTDGGGGEGLTAFVYFR